MILIQRTTACLAILTLAAFITTKILADEGALKRYDIVLLQGRIVDGTGAPWYVADIGIRDGKIAEIGRIDAKSAEQSIDAKGLIVAPGFIDMMGQRATSMLRDPF